MLLAPHVPIPDLDLAADADLLLALAPLVDGPDGAYAVFHRERAAAGARVVLDNGAFEGAPPMAPTEAVARADAVGAVEIQLPEFDDDGPRSAARARAWLDALTPADRARFCWHAVVTGHDADALEACVAALVRLPELGVLGVPRDTVERCLSGPAAEQRPRLLSQLRPQLRPRLSDREDVRVHLLGLGHPGELRHYGEAGVRVRGVDTSLPVRHAVHGIRYGESPETIPPPPSGPLDFRAPLGAEARTLARHNLARLRAWCR